MLSILLRILLISVSLGFPLGLSAVTPEEFFHNGATNYISGKIQEAKTAVESGLQNYPTNQMLLKLADLLKQQEQQQQSKDEQKDQSKQDEQSKEQKNKQQDQNKSDQQKPQPDQSEEKKKPEENQAQQKPDSSKEEKKQAESQKGNESKENKPDNPEDQPAEARQGVIARMTPQQAQQLLDAQKADEKAMIFVPKFKTNRLDRVFKDW